MHELLTPKELIIKTSAALILLLVVMLICSLIGSQDISLKSALFGSEKDFNIDYQILVRIRLPRVILAAVVGAALACSGVIFQALLRNPLADPYILGISSGAGLGVTIATITGLNSILFGISSIAIFAFVGALGTVWIVWMIGRFTGRNSVIGLLLAGVVVNAFFSAVIMFLTAVAKSDQIHSAIFWLMGNITEESFLFVWITTGLIITGIVALYFTAANLNAVSISDQDAASIGVNVNVTRFTAFSIAAFITALAVSLSGLIGFVGLVIPHAVRLVFGPDHRQLIPLSAFAGAIFLVVADTFARMIVAPAQFPVGVVTALVGGPFFLILLIKYSSRLRGFTK